MIENYKKLLDGLIKNIQQHMSLTLKMVLMSVLVGFVMWTVFDLTQTNKLKNIFQKRLTERLGQQAMEDRISFDRYVKVHLQLARLFVSQRVFDEYIKNLNWNAEDNIKIKTYRRSPQWFPKASVLRTFAVCYTGCRNRGNQKDILRS